MRERHVKRKLVQVLKAFLQRLGYGVSPLWFIAVDRG